MTNTFENLWNCFRGNEYSLIILYIFLFVLNVWVIFMWLSHDSPWQSVIVAWLTDVTSVHDCEGKRGWSSSSSRRWYSRQRQRRCLLHRALWRLRGWSGLSLCAYDYVFLDFLSGYKGNPEYRNYYFYEGIWLKRRRIVGLQEHFTIKRTRSESSMIQRTSEAEQNRPTQSGPKHCKKSSDLRRQRKESSHWCRRNVKLPSALSSNLGSI